MEDKEIKNYLKKIGIYSSNQILKHDLIYWWEKKYSDIQKSNLDQNLKKEKLIEINEIRESLEKYQPNELSRLLEAKESIEEIGGSVVILDNKKTSVNQTNKSEV